MGGGTGFCPLVGGAVGFVIAVVASVGVWAGTGVAVTARDCVAAGVAGFVVDIETPTAGAGDCEETLGSAGCEVDFETVGAGCGFGIDAVGCWVGVDGGTVDFGASFCLASIAVNSLM